MKMFITDFDGTLYRSNHTISKKDLNTLEMLNDNGITRVIATGRSLYSFQQALNGYTLPIDYLIFSTGAGIAKYPDPQANILKSEGFTSEQTAHILDYLIETPFDFMIHHPVPENHRFQYRRTGCRNVDFQTRIDFYAGYCDPISDTPLPIDNASQFLVIVPAESGNPTLQMLIEKLPLANVIQTTSPLDGRSVWIEIFPKATSKSLAAMWLAEQLDISSQECVATGNDYNDMDLLYWAGKKYLVSNGPEAMRKVFPLVSSNNESGVSEAVFRALEIS
jgi:hypothetical protein